jgi:catechol-2,3-dioxygenase
MKHVVGISEIVLCDGKHPVLASRTMYVDDPNGNEVEFICRAPAS